MFVRDLLKIILVTVTSIIEILAKHSDQILPGQYGREFVVPFLESLFPGNLYLTISALGDAEVSITNAAYDIHNTVNILAGESETLTLPLTIAPSRTDSYGQRSVYVRSDTYIGVYAFNFCYYSSASFIVLPIKALGTQYFLASYGYFVDKDVPSFSLVSTEENTTILLSFRISNNGKCGPESLSLVDGSEYNVHLNKFEDFTVYCTGEPTGTFVSSNLPIAVVSGHVGSMIPAGVTGRDEMAEMLPPVTMYGMRYVLHGPSKDRGALFRIIGSQNNITLTTSEGTTYSINRGDFQQLDLLAGEPLCLQTTLPVMVIMYGKGAKAGPDDYGDPFMIVVTPVELFSDIYVSDVSVLNMSSFISSVSLVMKSTYAQSLGIEYDVQTIPSCLYSMARYDIRDGRVDFHVSRGITYSALVYSLARFQAHAFSLGAASKLHTIWEQCTSNRCLHNGTCREDLFTYTCTCLPEYTGNICEETLSSEESIQLQSSTSNAFLQSSNLLDTVTNLYSGQILETGSTMVETSTSVQETTASIQESTVLLQEHWPFISEPIRSTVQESLSFIHETPASIQETPASIHETPPLIPEMPGHIPSSHLHLADLFNSIMTSSIENHSHQISVLSSTLPSFSEISQNEDLPVSQSANITHITSTMLKPVTSVIGVTVTNGPAIVTSSHYDVNITPVTSSATIERSTALRSITADNVTNAADDVTYASDGVTYAAAVTYQTCPCTCPLSYNSEDMSGLIGSLTQKIHKKLHVDKRGLSKTVRKLTSATDERPSAKYMGGGAVAILVAFFVIFIVADFVKIVKDLIYGLH